MGDPLSERKSYERGSLELDASAHDPLTLLRTWLDEASGAGILEPNAMCLATVSSTGKPSSRFVLLRSIGPSGLSFFTNYRSRKGREIEFNPFVAATFWWGLLERQVRIEGRAEKVSADESDAYFDSRPLESRIASAASPQSERIESREALDDMVQQHALRCEGKVSRPNHWGGYRIVPDSIEFWQGRPARLHDRLLFRRSIDGWEVERLAP